MNNLSRRIERVGALIEKEGLQVVRDPSALLIAFALPAILMIIFGYGLSLDARNIKIAVVLDDRAPLAQELWIALDASPYFDALYCADRRAAERAMIDSQVSAVLIAPSDFSKRAERGEPGVVQLLTDGVEANLALIVENYVSGVYSKCVASRLKESGERSISSNVVVETQTRYNTAQITRNSLLPGSIAIILAMIGTLMTTMVVAREWDRGTMEATLATPVGKLEQIVGKLIPYFLLGLMAACGSAFCSRYLFDVPFRGSIGAFLLTSSVFLLAATSQGLLISTVCREQNTAAQIAVLTSFLPNFLLSNVIFELDSAPRVVQWISYVFPSRYYVECLQTIFMARDAWSLLWREIGAMSVVSCVILTATIVATRSRLE